MRKSRASLRVRYGETDQMGGVYYANYIVWFEIGRSALLREAGCAYKELEKGGCILPVVESYCKYRAPAYYDEHLLIETWIAKLTKRDLTFSYAISRGDRLLAEGYTRHIPINPNGRRISLPPHLFPLLSPYVEEDRARLRPFPPPSRLR